MFENYFKVWVFPLTILAYFSDEIMLSVVGYGASRESSSGVEGGSRQEEM